MNRPRYVAWCAALYIDAGDSLLDLLQSVRDLAHGLNEDVGIWEGTRLVGVLLSGGFYVGLDGQRRAEALARAAQTPGR
jgi:hypothetical protein